MRISQSDMSIMYSSKKLVYFCQDAESRISFDYLNRINGARKFLNKWNEDQSLLKRNVDINDVGGSALYLISDLAAAVTGEIHYVDAGYNKVAMPNPKNIT